jgi:hypothetical protein
MTTTYLLIIIFILIAICLYLWNRARFWYSEYFHISVSMSLAWQFIEGNDMREEFQIYIDSLPDDAEMFPEVGDE